MRTGPWILMLALLVAVPARAERTPRYLARFADGEYQAGDVLTDWHETEAQPRLDDRLLLDPQNPLRWLCDRRLRPSPRPTAVIELWNGDCLPGTAVGYQPAGEDVQPRRACWLVRPGFALRPPHPVAEQLLSVEARFVRRVVWRSRRETPYQPGTAVLRGGGRVRFRSLRLTAQAALLLLDEGTRRVTFADLDELHLPWQDPWPLLFAELGGLVPDAETRLLQLETDDGLRATGSLQRFAAFALGGSKYADRWVHGIQPIWSSEVLWIPCGNIRMRRMWDCDQQPLSRVTREPMADLASGAAWPPRIDTNVQGSRLRAAGQLAGWGFGVHAPQRLTFPLPASPRPLLLSGSVGLDSLAGDGGCVRAVIRTGRGAIRAGESPGAGRPDRSANAGASPPAAADTTLFASPILVGSDASASFDALRIPGSESAGSRLQLAVDTAHDARPPGADPFAIRDIVDWAEPVLRFDGGWLQPQIAEWAADELAAWQGWRPFLPEDARWRVRLKESAGRPGAFQAAVSLDASPLSLVRRMRWTPDDAWLVLAVSQDRAQQDRPLVTVFADGERIHEQEVPFTDKWRYQVDPILVPLRDWIRDEPRDTVVEIRLHPGQQPTPVVWEAIAMQQRLPMIRRLLEEPGRGSPAEPLPNPGAWTDADAHVGKHSLRLAEDVPLRLPLNQPLRIREKPTWGEFRFLRFAFRPTAGGMFTVELPHRDSPARPARYHAGTSAPPEPETRRIWDRALEDRWIVITRDLYADFGAIDLQELVFRAEGGGPVLLDHVVLAMMSGNLELANPRETIPARPDDQALAAMQPAMSVPLGAEVRIDFGDGRSGCGTIVNQQGQILTAGHLVRSPGRTVQVTLADGSVQRGQTCGVCREYDLGMVALPGPTRGDHAHVDSTRELNAREWYFAVAAGETGRGTSSTVRPVRMLRAESAFGRSDFERPDACGAALLNRGGHVVGIAVRRSRFGGLQFVPTRDIFEVLPRLAKNEVWGPWLPLGAPQLPFPIIAETQGCVVGELAGGETADPRAAAGETTMNGGGLRPGDLVLQVDGTIVRNPDDVDRALADRSPGDQVTVQVRHDGPPRPIRVRLCPR